MPLPPAGLRSVAKTYLTVLLIESVGYEVVAVDNGVDAIAAVEREQFALIFMDIMMREMDGYQSLANIRGQERPKHPPA